MGIAFGVRTSGTGIVRGPSGKATIAKTIAVLALSVVAALAFSAAKASAETCNETWKGTSESSWTEAKNWSPEKVPSATETACIGAGKSATLGTSVTVGAVNGAGTLTIFSASLQIAGVEHSSIGTLRLEGELSLSGELSVTSSFLAERSSKIKGPSQLTLASGASGMIGTPSECTPLTLDGTTLVNDGTLALGEEGKNTGAIIMSEKAQFDNAKIFNDYGGMSGCSGGEASFKNSEGESGAAITNTGSFTTSVTPRTLMAVFFVNEGELKVKQGELIILNGATGVGGIWAVESGATLATDSAISLTGDTWMGTGRFVITGNKVTATLLNGKLATVEVNSRAELAVPSAISAIGNLVLPGGTVTVNPTSLLNVTSSLSATNGATMTGTGEITLARGATGKVGQGSDCVAVTFKEGSFVNNGTITFGESGGSFGGTIELSEGARFDNAGTFIDDAVGTKCGKGELSIGEQGTPESRFTNGGTFKVNAGTKTIEVEPHFAIDGPIKVESGHLVIYHPIIPEGAKSRGGENPSTPKQRPSHCGGPVECATGDYYEVQTDLSVGGRGVGLNLTRTYNSQAAVEGILGPFGYGWSSPFSDHLKVEPSNHKATLVQANGSTVVFSESGGVFTAPVSSQDKLSGSEGAGYTLTLENQTKYVFNGKNDRLESVTDRNKNETTLSYNSEERLETITDPAKRSLTFKYHEGLVESVTDPMGHTVKYTYEGKDLATVTEPGETSPRWAFKYEANKVTEMIDGRGGKTINKYNGANQVELQTDPEGHVLKFEYGSFQTTITNEATGAVTYEEFSSENEPVVITHGFGSPEPSTETFTYNEAGEETTATDGNGHTTEFGYEEGNRTSETNADGDETRWGYNGTHDVISTTTPNNETTTIEREADGNAKKVERPAPKSEEQKTEYRYKEHGEVEEMIDPLGHHWKYGYNEHGDRTSEEDPEKDKRTWEYNEDSQVSRTTSPRGNVAGEEAAKYATKIERDAQNRATSVVEPPGEGDLFAKSFTHREPREVAFGEPASLAVDKTGASGSPTPRTTTSCSSTQDTSSNNRSAKKAQRPASSKASAAWRSTHRATCSRSTQATTASRSTRVLTSGARLAPLAAYTS